MLRGLTAPEKLSEKTFDELVNIPKKHSVQTFIIAKRFRFNKQDKKPKETFRDFIAALQKLSENCAFGAYLNYSI